MATFIKAGFWEQLCKPCTGYKGWLNLDKLIADIAGPGVPGPEGPQGVQGEQGIQGVQGEQGIQGTAATGSYIKTGQMVNFAINVSCATVTNFGTIAGQYLLTLPFVAANIVSVVGAVYDFSTGKWYHMRGLTSVGSNVLTLWDGNSSEYTKMNGNSPINLTTADSFHISGTYQTI